MAKETITRISDDIDGSDANSTVAFTWNGVAYQIDLSTKNIREFEKAVAPYVAAARRISGTARKPRGKNAASAPKLNLEEIRSWAKENGHKVADRGRIPGAVLDAFHAAKKAVTEIVAPPTPASAPRAAKKAPAQKAPAKKAVAQKAPAKKAPAEQAPAAKAPVKKAVSQKAVAQKAPAKKAAPAKRGPAQEGADAPKLSLDEIRSWAKDNGHKVADRGRISGAVVDAFHAATKAIAGAIEPQSPPAADASPQKVVALQSPAKRAPRKAAARKPSAGKDAAVAEPAETAVQPLVTV